MCLKYRNFLTDIGEVYNNFNALLKPLMRRLFQDLLSNNNDNNNNNSNKIILKCYNKITGTL